MPAKTNAFGEVRAEQDHEMLQAAFHEWQDYKSLFESTDRFIVVGRRGTGKSALTYRLKSDWSNRSYTVLVIAPQEEQMRGLRPVASMFGTTTSRIRAGIKIAWRYAMLMEIGFSLQEHYKTKRDVEARNVLSTHLKSWRTKGDEAIQRIRKVLRETVVASDSEDDRIADLSVQLQLNRITEDVVGILNSVEAVA
jgi:GTPase SAR1 family protein